MIYVIGTSEPMTPVKIGFSADTQSACLRLRNLQVGNHRRLFILNAFSGLTTGANDRQLEYDAHRSFAHAKLVGEWFDPLVDVRLEHLALARGKEAVAAVWAEIEPAGFPLPARVRRKGWDDPSPSRGLYRLNRGRVIYTALQAAGDGGVCGSRAKETGDG